MTFNMKNKLIVPLLILVVLLFSVLYLFKKNSENYKDTLTNYKTNLNLNIFNNINHTFRSDFDLLDCEGNKITIKQLIDSKPKLVLCINNTMCEQCIIYQLNLIKKHLSKLQNDDIVILASYLTLNDLRIIKKKYNFEHNAYFIVRNYKTPDFLLDSRIDPILFIVNNSLDYSSIYFTDKNLPDMAILYYNKISNYFSHRYSKEKKAQEGILFEKELIELGKLKVGSDTTVYIKYINKMKSPLIIESIKTSCGCTVVEWDKKPLLTGKQGVIKIRYKAETAGIFFKSIMIQSNAPNNPVKIIITGNR